jgi:uncharacterized protein (TIGR02452 family)
MGRTEKSQGLAPPSIRKDIRAKQARHIVNKVIPAILASNPRARKGVDGSELIANPGPYDSALDIDLKGVGREGAGGDEEKYIKRKGQGRRKAKGGGNKLTEVADVAYEKDSRMKRSSKKRNDSLDESLSNLTIQPLPKPTIRITTTDTLTAVTSLLPRSKNSRKNPNPCILNMASPLRPGGGVLTGATSQEEFLCVRTTLLPSLREHFYRLPEYGGIFTRDVLVFRNALSLSDPASELGSMERCYVDVITAGMLRFPELEGGDEEMKRLAKGDREMVEEKMRAVMRIASSRGVKRIVLGAWGCGAYGNPVRDVAEAWCKVLTGGKKASSTTEQGETWAGIEEIVFAISNQKMAREFAYAFDPSIEIESGPAGSTGEEEEEEEEADAMAKELRTKIAEMEGQLGSVWSPHLKQRMDVILDGLRAQLQEREEEHSGESCDEDDEESSGHDKNAADGKVEGDEETDQEDSEDGDQHGGLELPSVS